MTDDLFERLRGVDPVTDERIAEESRGLGNTPARIVESEPSNVRRFPKAARRKATLIAVAAVVVVAIVLPLTLLRSLGDSAGTVGNDSGGQWVTVGSIADIRAEGVTYVLTPGAPTLGAFVIAPEGVEPFALSAVPFEEPQEATNERVLYCPAIRGFVGSRGDTYGQDGQISGGPVDHGLSPMGLRVQAGVVQIDPSDLSPGDVTRGESFLTGPPCETAGGVPLEGKPGFGIALGTELPPISVALPQRGMTLRDSAHIVGSADVFEATVSIRILDAERSVIVESFTTADCGTGCRGDYSADVAFSVGRRQTGWVQVFESSAKDGSMINTVEIPVTLVPGPVPATTSLNGVWFDGDNAPLPNGSSGSEGSTIAVFRGSEHCQWESATFMHLAWPVGTIASSFEGERQYVRDPESLFDDGALHVGYLSDTSLPSDATDTGYHRGPWRLWVSPSQADDAIFVVNADTGAVERWARATPPILCE